MEKGKIVVIDDSPLVRRLAEVALQEEGYKVFLAQDGEEGLKIANEVIPSLILVDFIMPKISGYQFCQMVREKDHLKDIPIILITGKGEDAGKKFMEKFGIADYFIKPFKSEALVAKVNEIMRPQETASPENAITFPEKEWEELEELGKIYGVDDEMPDRERELYVDTGLEPEGMEKEFSLTIDHMQEIADEAIATEGLEEKDTPRIIDEKKFPSFYELNIPGITEAEAGLTMRPDMNDIEEAVERAVEKAVRRFFYNEFPFSFNKTVSDVLKQSGMLKATGIIFSGNLSFIELADLLHLVNTSQLTGKLFVLSPVLNGEIYFDGGTIIYASTSKQGRDPFYGRLWQKGAGKTEEVVVPISDALAAAEVRAARGETSESAVLEDEIRVSFKNRLCEALYSVIALREGEFFFETMSIPNDLKNTAVRLNIPQIILEGTRQRGDILSPGRPYDNSSVFTRLMTNVALKDFDLTENESKVMGLIDDEVTLGDIIDVSGIDESELSRIIYSLAKAGILRGH
ncbi:MAG: response regulator [Dissulfurispiraceae bacterium]